MLAQDAKNYHVWSYRQWLVKRFDLFDKPEELEWTHGMIEDDVRNNSAWNHRYYLVVGGREGKPSADLAKREIEYVSGMRDSTPDARTNRELDTPKQPSARRRRTRALGTMF
jgi:protein farnesyltransferase/geranylgeranyltransferase type-1 subunit alpha